MKTDPYASAFERRMERRRRVQTLSVAVIAVVAIVPLVLSLAAPALS
ncbi:MAG: hypothetical protein J0J04_08295 [Microbacterium sp.]|nr:hypothetical protein [Microbacterium sp.]MBN9214801.1 hypothetical protein [Microbacterium sp.]